MAKDSLAFGVEPSEHQYRLRLARYKALAETIAAYVRERARPRPLSLLDVGSGNGRTLRYLEAEGVADRVRFYGVDLSPKRLEHMYRPERWALVQANAEAGLPFPSAAFDIVVCEQVLEHLHDPRGVVREMARVMRPDGLLIAGVPIFPPGLFDVRRWVVPLVDRVMGKDRDHVQVFTSRRFARLFTQDLFEVQATRGFRIITGWPFGLLEDLRSWWRLNLAVGRAVPWLCTEVQLVARRRTVEAPMPAVPSLRAA
jgi:SAM-dependent methyltransferase